MKNKKVRLSVILNLAIYLVSISLLARNTILSNTLKWNNYSFSEYIISYPNKFIRRGLVGEVLTYLSNGESIFYGVQIVVFANCILFISLLFLLFKKLKIDIEFLSLLLLSSMGFFQLFFYGNFYFRKEMFYLNFFIILIFLVMHEESKKINKNIINIYLLLLTLIISLIHEGFLLVTTPFIFLLLRNKRINFHKFYALYSYGLFVLMILSQGDSQATNTLWDDLNSFDKSLIPEISSTAFSFVGYDYSFFLTTEYNGLSLLDGGNVFYWLFIIFYFILFLSLIFTNGSVFDLIYLLENQFKYEYILLSVPVLFCIGFDWGRFLVAVFYVLFLFLLYNLKHKISNFQISRRTLSFKFFVLMTLFTIIPDRSWQDFSYINKFFDSIDEIKFIFNNILNFI